MSQTDLIDHLTPEQTARFPEFVKRWTDIGLSTTPTDREAAERAIRLCYECAGIAPPRQITWRQSPLAGAMAMIAVRDSGASVRYSIWNTIRNSVRTSVGTSVRYSVWTGVWANVRTSVRDAVWTRVGASVWTSVWASVPGVWANFRAAVRNSIEGSFEAEWLSPYSYLLDCGGLKACEKMRGMFAQAEHCGWWWPFENAVIATDKPTALHLDDHGRLHHPTEAAISYGDGWGVYAWHGTRIPKRYYAKVVTPTEILRERNAEVRRALIERYGQDRFMLDCSSIKYQVAS
jgi:hypothetical protein